MCAAHYIKVRTDSVYKGEMNVMNTKCNRMTNTIGDDVYDNKTIFSIFI